MATPQIDPNRISNLIDGRAAEAESTLSVINPSTGALLHNAPVASLDDLERAVRAANAARNNWSRDPEARKRTISSMAKVIDENKELLANTLSLELGLPIRVASQEVSAASAFLKYRSRASARMDVVCDDETQNIRVIREPVGVVGAIAPWNAPLLMSCEKVGSAMAAGNTVIVKPSPLAPLTVLLFGSLVQDVVPSGVMNVMNGDEKLGSAMVSHPGINMISFTGSTATGMRIMTAAAPTMKRLSLELGGNDAAIIMPDSDPKKTAEKIFGAAFYRCGQICVGVKRVYVHQSIHDEFVDALSAIARSMVIGDPFEPDVTMGPVSNNAQFEKIKQFASSVEADGGVIVTGGKALNRSGFFFEPTIVVDVKQTARLVREEQFGPILPVLKFDSEDEAIRLANDTPYGLGNSVWTGDREAGQRIAEQLQSGTVWINRHGMILPNVPFGGMKHSGIGRTNGDIGFDHYCELKSINASL